MSWLAHSCSLHQGTQCKVALVVGQWQLVLISPSSSLNSVSQVRKLEHLPLNSFKSISQN